MSYRISIVTGSDAERREIAAFLAAFVRDGELLKPRCGDDDPAKWEQRMRWWWDENPHCLSDSPRGYRLDHETAGLVGFSGLIPFRYEAGDETVPTLVTTTLFVRECHRSAVMGLLSRQRELGRRYHLVDGSPSPEMRRILDKFGYRHAGDRIQFLFPTRRLGGALARTALLALECSFPLPSSAEAEDFQLVLDPADWEEPSVDGGGHVRRSADPETLRWLARSGSDARQFLGLVDEDGRPVARALGVYKQRGPVKACLLLDHHDFHPGGAGLGLLLRKAIDAVGEGVLDPATGLLVLSRFGVNSHHGVPGRRVESILRYHLPPPWQDLERDCLPVEGDLALL
jgi:hypothetical protein